MGDYSFVLDKSFELSLNDIQVIIDLLNERGLTVRQSGSRLGHTIELDIRTGKDYSYVLVFYVRKDRVIIFPKGRMVVKHRDILESLEYVCIELCFSCSLYEGNRLLRAVEYGIVVADDDDKDFIGLNEEALSMYIDYKLMELNDLYSTEDLEGVSEVEDELKELVSMMKMYE